METNIEYYVNTKLHNELHLAQFASRTERGKSHHENHQVRMPALRERCAQPFRRSLRRNHPRRERFAFLIPKSLRIHRQNANQNQTGVSDWPDDRNEACDLFASVSACF